MSIDRLDNYIQGLDSQYQDRLLSYDDAEGVDDIEYDFEVEEKERYREKKSSLINIYNLLDNMVNDIESEIDNVIEAESKNKRVNYSEAEELIEISRLIHKITKRKE